MHRDLRLNGKWMYSRRDVADLLQLVANGVLPLGEAGGLQAPRAFALEQWEEAFDRAAEEAGFGKSVVITP